MTTEKCFYDEYLKCKKNQGFGVETLKITEKSFNFITTFNVEKSTINTFLEIRCPAGKIMAFPGRSQFKNREDAYSQYVNLFDENGNNIDFSNVIRIEVLKPSTSIKYIDNVLYNDISLYTNGLVKKDYNKFRFDEGFELMSENLLRFIIMNSKNNINKVEFIMKCNMLHKH